MPTCSDEISTLPSVADLTPQPTAKTPGGSLTLTLTSAVICLVLVATDLRPGIASIGPLLPRLRDEFNLSNTQASLLTSIPTLLMGVLALAAPRLAHRFGRNRVILVALLVLTLSTAARAFSSSLAQLLLMTGGVGAGIAIAGALIGGFVKASFPKQAALLIGIYAMALGLGSTIAAAATGPLSAIFASWRLGAGIWTLPGLMAMAAWLHVARAEAHPKGSPSAKSPALLAPLPFKNPTAWATAAYLSLTNILFFGLLSWLAPMYRELGASETKAGLILASFAGAFMLANPLPGLFSRNDDRRAMIGAFALAALIGMIALAIAPGGSAFLIVPLIAIGIGGSFTLGMTLPLDNAKSADDANAWNAFTMSIGYAVGALGPLLVGIMRDVTGGFQAPMWFLATVGLLMLSLAPILQPHHHRVSKTIAQKPQKMASRRSV